jgi:hypothetical protein
MTTKTQRSSKNQAAQRELRNIFVPVRLTQTEEEILDSRRKNVPRATFLVTCFRQHTGLDQ